MSNFLVRAAAACAFGFGLAGAALAQNQQVVAICATDQGWCELAAKEFQAQTGIKVLQVHKATGEALAQLRAESQNPKTDLWWGGTGDPYLQAAEVGLLDAGGIALVKGSRNRQAATPPHVSTTS